MKDKKIEKLYPEAYKLAREFHNLYEEIAPQFGYITRDDTKEFDPESPNGRTMAYVCYGIVKESESKLRKSLEEEIRGIPDIIKSKMVDEKGKVSGYLNRVKTLEEYKSDVLSKLNNKEETK